MAQQPVDQARWPLLGLAGPAPLQGKPLYVVGVSSGASFALKLPETVTVHGVVSGGCCRKALCVWL